MNKCHKVTVSFWCEEETDEGHIAEKAMNMLNSHFYCTELLHLVSVQVEEKDLPEEMLRARLSKALKAYSITPEQAFKLLGAAECMDAAPSPSLNPNSSPHFGVYAP